MNKKIEYIALIKKYEILIISGGIIIIIILLGFAFLKPNFDQANKIYKEQEILKSRFNKLKNKNEQLSSVDYVFFKDSFPKISQVLPENKEYASLFSTFDTLEKNIGITLTGTDFQLGVVSTNSSQLIRDIGSSAYNVPLTINIVGELSGIQKFIRSISDYTGRFMTADSITWETDEEGNYMATLNGKAYFYPLPTTLGMIDSPLPQFTSSQDKILTAISKLKIVSDQDASNEVIDVGKKDLFQ